jgi:hypothetical protein
MIRWTLRGLAFVMLAVGAASCTIRIEPRVPVERFAAPTPAGTGSPNACTAEGSPCTIARALQIAVCGDTITVLNGTYAGPGLPNGGSANLLALPIHVPGKSCTPSTRITVRAKNEGQAVIDANYDDLGGVWVDGNRSWVFEGFDISRGGVFVAAYTGTTTDLTFRRICASNVAPVTTRVNSHPWSINDLTDGLFEDICGFGVGRNMFVNPYNHNVTVRRIWIRHEGYAGFPGDTACDGGPAGQWGYHSNTNPNLIYENYISASTYEQLTPGHPCYSPTTPIGPYSDSMDLGQRGFTTMGAIIYVRLPIRFTMNHSGFFQRVFCTDSPGAWRARDIFIDARPYKLPTVTYTNEQAGAPCSVLLDRITALKTTAADNDTYSQTGSNAVNFQGIAPTNFKECQAGTAATGNNIGGCPHFYTGAAGSAGGLGSRACHEYQNGVLQDGTGGTTARPLWPWPMDDRIKAALQRENTRGQGGSALAGTAGSGYQANTVTSEIVSRYGAIPPACLRTPGPTPNPPAGLTLTYRAE